MNRKIVWINLVLLASLGWGAVELRRRWLEADRNANTTLRPGAGALPATAASPPPAPPAPALGVAQYFEVAERLLFAKDRNPMVVVEQKQEAPPKPMPDLPSVYGVMDLGMGPTVFMSLGAGGQQGYRVGDQVGDFKLTAASNKELTFEWEGKPIVRSLDDLVSASRKSSREAPMAAAAPPSSARPDFTPAPVVKPPENVRPAPGTDIGMGRRGCVAGDSSPEGTVVDGYKKVSKQYAFGPICYWEEAR